MHINKLNNFFDNVFAQLNCGGAVTLLLVLLEIEWFWLRARHQRVHCVVFLGKTPYSHSASLQPGVIVGTSKFIAWGGGHVKDWNSIHGE